MPNKEKRLSWIIKLSSKTTLKGNYSNKICTLLCIVNQRGFLMCSTELLYFKSAVAFWICNSVHSNYNTIISSWYSFPWNVQCSFKVSAFTAKTHLSCVCVCACQYWYIYYILAEYVNMSQSCTKIIKLVLWVYS